MFKASPSVLNASTITGVLIASVIVTRVGWSDIFAAALSAKSSGTGLMAFAAAGYLAWLRRSWFQTLGKGSVGALVVAVMAGSVYFLGVALDARVLLHVGAIFFALGAVASILQPGAWKPLLPIGVALLFAIPIPGFVSEWISIPLQMFDAYTVETLGQALGLPVSRVGTLIVINGTTVDIDAGCDGLRLVWPMLLAVHTAVCAGRATRLARLTAILLAVPAALILNFIRLALTTYLYGYTDPQIASISHDALGWILVISAGFVPFVLLDRAASAREQSGAQATTSVFKTRAASFGVAAPVGTALAATLLILTASSVSDPVTSARADQLVRHRVETLPYRIDRWIGEDRAVPQREKEILAADALVQRVYHQFDNDARLLFMVAYHRDGRRAMGHRAPRCYRVRGWEILTESPSQWTLDGIQISGSAYVLSRGTSRMTVFEFFSDMISSEEPQREAAKDEQSVASIRVQVLFDGVKADDLSTYETVGRFLESFVSPDKSNGAKQST